MKLVYLFKNSCCNCNVSLLIGVNVCGRKAACLDINEVICVSWVACVKRFIRRCEESLYIYHLDTVYGTELLVICSHNVFKSRSYNRVYKGIL